MILRAANSGQIKHGRQSAQQEEPRSVGGIHRISSIKLTLADFSAVPWPDSPAAGGVKTGHFALLPDRGGTTEATHARLVGRSCRHLLKHREGLARVCLGETIRFGLSRLHAGMFERESV